MNFKHRGKNTKKVGKEERREKRKKVEVKVKKSEKWKKGKLESYQIKIKLIANEPLKTILIFPKIIKFY